MAVNETAGGEEVIHPLGESAMVGWFVRTALALPQNQLIAASVFPNDEHLFA